MGGDSAGGNLTLAVLSVILHGFPNIEAPKLAQKLAGALLISPWVSFEYQTASWKQYGAKDVVSAESSQQLTELFVGPDEHNNYSEPGNAKSSWWENLAARRILNVYGGCECLRDSQVELGRSLKKSGNEVEDVECEGHIHIDCILDAQTGMQPGKMAHTIQGWLLRVFSSENK